MRRHIALAATLSFLCAAPVPLAHAGWADVLDKVQSQIPATTGAAASANSAAGLSDADVGKGLKEALAKGTQKAVASLGQSDGYFTNQAVKILLPESIQKLEAPLRLAGQGKLIDDLVLTMNRAAEKAVPEAASILADSVKAMTLQDAKGILTGPQDAATQFFRKSSGEKINTKMLPIVSKATDSAGVTKAYKRLTANPIAASVAQAYGADLDSYVTGKAVDGLFTMVAKEEAAIRTNPAERTTAILQKVFGNK
jgi:hypothetical protein